MLKASTWNPADRPTRHLRLSSSRPRSGCYESQPERKLAEYESTEVPKEQAVQASRSARRTQCIASSRPKNRVARQASLHGSTYSSGKALEKRLVLFYLQKSRPD